MSYGSISLEAHTTLAEAMNKIGGKSNTGVQAFLPNLGIPNRQTESKAANMAALVTAFGYLGKISVSNL